MTNLQISQNIIRLRREQHVTQEQLAEHVGVTKGAVSKWENGTTLPDVSTLPLLAAFFDVSIDALLGYAPALSAKQIQAYYRDFAKAFSERPFAEVLAEVQSLVKTYYSCWPLLYQMSLLLLNHVPLAKEPSAQQQTLSYMERLLERVLAQSDDAALKSDARVLESMIWLQQGKVDEAIHTLEVIADPMRLTQQSDGLLVQAYVMKGDLMQADRHTQFRIYLALQTLLGRAVNDMTIHAADHERLRTTTARIAAVTEAYDLLHLNPNGVAQFSYQAAIVALGQGLQQETYQQLDNFVAAMEVLFAKDGFRLHGDDYFNLLDHWIEQLDQGENAPRDRDTVRQDVLQHFEQPFAAIADAPEFRRLQTKLKAVLG